MAETDGRLERLRRAIEARGWAWRGGKPIPYGEQLIIGGDGAEATLDFYPKRGRYVVGGSPGPLRQAVQQLADQVLATGGPAAVAGPGPARFGSRFAMGHIGMDESGKGDWFGPLVVAAVAVDEPEIPRLIAAGVRDSKELDEAGLGERAARIRQLLPAARIELVSLDPAEYNRRYGALGNINLLLSELYAEAAAALLGRVGRRTVVCDQFAQRADRLDRAFAAAGLPRPTQLHRAEQESVAVAAASILAASHFRAELGRLGRAAGLGAGLPRGATAVRALRGAARQILRDQGREGLGRYAKLNFQPVRELLGEG